MRNLKLRIAIAWLALTVAGYAACVSDTPQAKVDMQKMTVAELEKAGDDCRAVKDYEQAIQYFRAALNKDKKNAKLYNKLGLAELKNDHLVQARSDFGRAVKYDSRYPEALNNIGATYYVEKKYGNAAKYFKKAVALDETHASFHVNLGAAWFAQNEIDRAVREYTRALELDPTVLTRDSRVGVTAQITSPEERARHEYMMAKIYAKMGYVDNCLVCLKKAKESGYRGLENVYKDQEFATVRLDPRLAEIVPPPVGK